MEGTNHMSAFFIKIDAELYSYNKPIPAILEIPSKDHPYDPTHDSVLS